ncbi:alpha-N-arabinofuranosidase [Duganella sp. FT92W]|uniref:non-reducing end alpha-L-arabinofuranosidase n=1 Tax=Pseudoduganella rivuli TaxID=2666085 RepID=A0A7X2LRV7_9BURK|nr:alpha-L-arabinofuranosidase C-terminal domain-containing protein [Pseudoduganella rivuli]MRV70322.1 alpha-N-arabinofuranosidase [Pseudoduganella rivuli]
MFYKKFIAAALALAAASASCAAQLDATFDVRADQPAAQISRNLYGHFVEHLGRGVYEGIWVGERSAIPNTRGIRNDVVAALRKLNVPVVRWPGGCFADVYHWQDGIGPRDKRPLGTNTSWGNIQETNAFGTHEFMDFVSQVGARPYVGVNMGTGTTAEGKAWMEYMTAPPGTPAAKARQQNGQEAAWDVPFVGVGNESWGCGGQMRAEFYADQYRLYQGFLHGYSKNKPFFVAAGPDSDDYHWTETVMERAMDWRERPVAPLLYNVDKPLFNGLALHFYTLASNDWFKMGDSAGFPEKEWISTLKRALTMDELIRKHSAIMDRHDPGKKVALVVDEWGTWYKAANNQPSSLYQQNTLRDALVAAVTLNIFHHHSDRVRMANIAQMVNVLQSVILTDKEKMLLTPTYHVFDMYQVHQDATHIPVELQSPQYRHGEVSIPALSVSASRGADGKIHISVANLDPHHSIKVSARLKGFTARSVTGQVLTAGAMDAHNDFDAADRFVPVALKGVAIVDGQLRAEFPAKSVTVLELQPSGTGAR